MRNIFKETIVVAIWALCLVFRFGMIENSMDQSLSRLSGTVKISGCIVEEVDVRDDGNRYVLDLGKSSFKILVFARKYPLYEYGDCLDIRGRIADPDSRGDFNYADYLKRYGIYKVMYADSVALVSGGEGNVFFAAIFKLKRLFEERLGRIFVEPYRSFMAGLLAGSRRGLPDHLTDDFKTVGLSHIMAISGYNITMVIVVMGGLLWFLKKNIRIIVSGVFVVIFVIFVGMSASAVRAAIMGIIGLFSLRFGRQYIASRGLLTATIIMSIWNPRILLSDAGFQLSVLATLGLIYICPRLKKKFEFLPEIFGIRETFAASLSAQIAVLPILIWNFRQVSLVGIFANLLVLPLIPVAMLLGFLAVTGSMLCNFLGGVIGFMACLILRVVIAVVELFAVVPFATLHL